MKIKFPFSGKRRELKTTKQVDGLEKAGSSQEGEARRVPDCRYQKKSAKRLCKRGEEQNLSLLFTAERQRKAGQQKLSQAQFNCVKCRGDGVLKITHLQGTPYLHAAGEKTDAF